MASTEDTASAGNQMEEAGDKSVSELGAEGGPGDTAAEGEEMEHDGAAADQDANAEMMIAEDDDDKAAVEGDGDGIDDALLAEGDTSGDGKGTNAVKSADSAAADGGEADAAEDIFEVIDEVPGDEEVVKEDAKAEEGASEPKKKEYRGPLSLVVYPIQLRDLDHQNLQEFFALSKSSVTKFVGQRDKDKNGIIYARFKDKEIKDEAMGKVKGLTFSDGRKPMVRPGFHRATLFSQTRYIRKMEKRSIAEDEEPTSVFVNNIPATANSENMLKVLFPTARSIQLPLNSQGKFNGYGILEYSSRQEARTMFHQHKKYKARIGQNQLRLTIVGCDDFKERDSEPAVENKELSSEKTDKPSPVKQGSEQKGSQPPKSAQANQNKGKPNQQQQANAQPGNQKRQLKDSTGPSGKKRRTDDKTDKPDQSKAETKSQGQPKAKTPVQSPSAVKKEGKPPQKATPKQQPSVDGKKEGGAQGETGSEKGAIATTASKNAKKNKRRNELKKLQRQGAQATPPAKPALGNQRQQGQQNVRNINRGQQNRQQQRQSNFGNQSFGQLSRNKQRQQEYMMRQQMQYRNQQLIQNRLMNPGQYSQSSNLGAMPSGQLQGLGLGGIQPALLQGLKSLITASVDAAVGGRSSGSSFGQSNINFPLSGFGSGMSGSMSNTGFSNSGMSGNRMDRGFSNKGMSGNRTDRSFSNKGMSGNRTDRSFSNKGMSGNRTDRGFSNKGMSGNRTDGGFSNTGGNRTDGGFSNTGMSGNRTDGGFSNTAADGTSSGKRRRRANKRKGLDQGSQNQRSYSTISEHVGYTQKDHSANTSLSHSTSSSNGRGAGTSLLSSLSRGGGYDLGNQKPSTYSSYTEQPMDVVQSGNTQSFGGGSAYSSWGGVSGGYDQSGQGTAPNSSLQDYRYSAATSSYGQQASDNMANTYSGLTGMDAGYGQQTSHSYSTIPQNYYGQQATGSAMVSSFDTTGDSTGRSSGYDQTRAYSTIPATGDNSRQMTLSNLSYTDTRGASSGFSGYDDTVINPMSYSRQADTSASNAATSRNRSPYSYGTSRGQQSGHDDSSRQVCVTNIPNVTVPQLVEFLQGQMVSRYICQKGDNCFSNVTPMYSGGKTSVVIEFTNKSTARFVVRDLDSILYFGSPLSIKMHKPSVTSQTFTNTSRKKKRGLSGSGDHMGMMGNTNDNMEVYVGNLPQCTANELNDFFTQAIDQLGLQHQKLLKVKYRPGRSFQFLVFEDSYTAKDVVQQLNGVTFKNSAVTLRMDQF